MRSFSISLRNDMHYEFYDAYTEQYEEDVKSLEESDIFPQLDTLPNNELLLTANEVDAIAE